MFEIVIAGCGALGSQLAVLLSDVSYRFTLIDFDEVEPGNEENSAYVKSDIGKMKAFALAQHMWAKSGVAATPIVKKIDDKMLSSRVWEVDLIVDALDDPVLKHSLCGGNVVHLGMSVNRTGIVRWRDYEKPTESDEENEVCTRQLGLGIAAMTAAAAYNSIRGYLETGVKIDMLVGETWVKSLS